jgi:hypothetical protein
VAIEAGGEGVVAHVGLHALGAFADRLGLGDALSARIPPAGERLPLHDRGKVLTQAMLMLAGGGESCADIEALRAQERLFGAVPSDSTLYRTFRQIGPATLAGLWDAMAEIRAQVWRRSSMTNTADPVVLDIDATLVEIHSENKDGTGPTYKRTFGFHPMACFADATGEALAARLRPGNAGANTVADHLAVLDDAVAQLPAEIAVGHRPGEDAELVARAVVVRTDSAGATHGFVDGCRDATSASPSWPARTARSRRRFRGPTPRPSPGGHRRAARTARCATAPRWPSSPTLSTCRTGRTAPG